MSRFVGMCSVLVALAMGSAPAFGQDDFSPSNDELNQDLDRSLQQEFDDDHPPPPEAAPPRRRFRHGDREHKKRFEVTLSLMGAYYYTGLHDVEVGYREGLSGGGLVKLADHENHKGNAFEFENGAGTYSASLDLGKHIAITGGFRMVRYQDTETLTNDPNLGTQGFTFGDTTFQAGDRVKAQFDMLVADSDFVFRPLNNEWVTIDMSVGARYIYWKSTFERRSGPPGSVSSRIEGAMPMVGLGLAVRPVSVLEIFGRFRFGGLDYEVDRNDYSTREINKYNIKNIDREMRSYEADLGIKLLFGDHIGLIVGYRLDYIKLVREVDARDERVKAKSHGAYGGLIIAF